MKLTTKELQWLYLIVDNYINTSPDGNMRYDEVKAIRQTIREELGYVKERSKERRRSLSQ